MNLLLLDRFLLYLLDGLRQAGTVITTQWTQEERLQALNNSYSEICKLIRRNRRDHFTIRRLSTDGSVFIRNQTFNCGNFQIVSGTASYTMPPDYLEIRGVRPLTAGRESVTFTLVDESNEEYRDRRRGTSATNPTQPGIYWCAVTGERTFTIAPTPQETLDIELAYVAQPRRLVLYTGVHAGDSGGAAPSPQIVTGTCTVTNGSTAVQFTSDVGERQSGIIAGDELLVGSFSVQAAPDLRTRYHKLATVSAAGTDAALADAYLGLTTGSAAYTLASAPAIHEDWQYGIAHGAVWELLKAIEGGAEEAREAAFKNRERIWGSLIPESAQRSSQEAETAEDGWSIFEG